MESTNPQTVLILVGFIGSGKSTFATALQAHFPEFVRCNQDELGDRRAVEDLARATLRNGGSVCIDRTNIDASQRATWVRIARERPGALVWVLHFATPFEVCEQRLRSRTSHPTITSVEQGISVLRRFRSQYQPPEAWEGCDQMLALGVVEQPASSEYTLEDITNILEKLRASPRIPPSTWDVGRASNPGRGRGQYPQRGGYQPRGYSRGWGAPPRGRGGYSGGWANGNRYVRHTPLMSMHSLNPGARNRTGNADDYWRRDYVRGQRFLRTCRLTSTQNGQ